MIADMCVTANVVQTIIDAKVVGSMTGTATRPTDCHATRPETPGRRQ